MDFSIETETTLKSQAPILGTSFTYVCSSAKIVVLTTEVKGYVVIKETQEIKKISEYPLSNLSSCFGNQLIHISRDRKELEVLDCSSI